MKIVDTHGLHVMLMIIVFQPHMVIMMASQPHGDCDVFPDSNSDCDGFSQTQMVMMMVSQSSE